VADVAVVVVPADHLHVSVAIGPHEDVQLLPHRVHGCRRLSQPFPTEKRRGSAGEAGLLGFLLDARARCAAPRRDGEGDGEEMRSGSDLLVAGSLSLSLCCVCCLDGLGLFLTQGWASYSTNHGLDVLGWVIKKVALT
jgi:hypothetical protein